MIKFFSNFSNHKPYSEYFTVAFFIIKQLYTNYYIALQNLVGI